jgi:integrase
VRQTIESLPASGRTQTLVALRSLFGYLHRRKRVFATPTSRLVPGPARRRVVLLPLTAQDYQQLTAACVTPMHELVLALACVDAGSPNQIRHLLLDDFDLANRRLTIGSVSRRLDAYTLRALDAYLRHRRERWPAATNRHLLISKYTARTTGPVSSYTIGHLFPPHLPGIDRLRRDRQLEEALAHGPDPLHLAVVFGITQAPPPSTPIARGNCWNKPARRQTGRSHRDSRPHATCVHIGC